MEAPPVHYVTTSDGFDIAYTVEGEGLPFVVAPLAFSHIQVDRGLGFPWFEGLVKRFRVIRYDARGQGLSTRGLPEDLTTDSYVLDLEAVVARLRLPPFVAYGFGNALGHVALRYAAKHPENVRSLIMQCSAIQSSAWPMAMYIAVAEQNWPAFLASTARNVATSDMFVPTFERLQQATTQQDWLTMQRVFSASDVTGLLPRLTMPTLVLHPRDFHALRPEESIKLAARLPDSRLVLIGGSSPLGEPAENLAAIDAFIGSLPAPGEPSGASAGGVKAKAAHSLPHGLSARELDVLRLLAVGRSNQQIADELVISLNTVRRHVSNIFDKTGVANRAQATAYAKDNGLA